MKKVAVVFALTCEALQFKTKNKDLRRSCGTENKDLLLKISHELHECARITKGAKRQRCKGTKGNIESTMKKKGSSVIGDRRYTRETAWANGPPYKTLLIYLAASLII